jgi:hypothetical protein
MSLYVASISPVPTEEEAAAIAAAVTMMWPQPVIATSETKSYNHWRFSGRWWANDAISRRGRPGA